MKDFPTFVLSLPIKWRFITVKLSQIHYKGAVDEGYIENQWNIPLLKEGGMCSALTESVSDAFPRAWLSLDPAISLNRLPMHPESTNSTLNGSELLKICPLKVTCLNCLVTFTVISLWNIFTRCLYFCSRSILTSLEQIWKCNETFNITYIWTDFFSFSNTSSFI